MTGQELVRDMGRTPGLTLLRPEGPGVTRARPGMAQGLWGGLGSAAGKRTTYEPGSLSHPLRDPELLFSLGSGGLGEMDPGECLETARRLQPEDASSWAREWTRTAERLREVAQHAEVKSRWISAGEAWLRASAYYRAALHRHPEPQGPDVVRLARHALVGFTRAVRLLGLPVQPVFIPYEHTSLPGYFFRSLVARGPAPVVLIHPGRDGWAEDSKSLAEAALQRGYHCLLFEGPGQGKVLRLKGIPFRPDWEKVVTPVVDWVRSQRCVDPERLALVGLGMSESLGPRMALFERRLKLCTAHPDARGWVEFAYELLMNARTPSPVGTLSVGSQRLFDWLDERL